MIGTSRNKVMCDNIIEFYNIEADEWNKVNPVAKGKEADNINV